MTQLSMNRERARARAQRGIPNKASARWIGELVGDKGLAYGANYQPFIPNSNLAKR